MSSIHDFNAGDKFCVGTYCLYSGEINIQDNLLLIWVGQFAYPSYRFLKDGNELRANEQGGDIFGKDYKEVADKILLICKDKINKYNNIIKHLEKKAKELDKTKEK